MASTKRTRSRDLRRRDGLRLHAEKLLPAAIEQQILSFVDADSLCSLLDTSAAMAALVNHFLAATTELTIDFHDTSGEARMKLLTLIQNKCCRLSDLRTGALLKPVSLWSHSWLCAVITTNAAKLQSWEPLDFCGVQWSQTLCDALASCPNLTDLRVVHGYSRKSIGVGAGLKEIMSSCKKARTLHTFRLTLHHRLKFCRCISLLETDVVCGMLQSAAAIRELCASDLAPEALLCLQGAQFRGLEILDLTLSLLPKDDDYCVKICTALAEILPTLPKLREFDFGVPSWEWTEAKQRTANASVIWRLPAAKFVTVSMASPPVLQAPNAQRLTLIADTQKDRASIGRTLAGSRHLTKLTIVGSDHVAHFPGNEIPELNEAIGANRWPQLELLRCWAPIPYSSLVEAKLSRLTSLKTFVSRVVTGQVEHLFERLVTRSPNLQELSLMTKAAATLQHQLPQTEPRSFTIVPDLRKLTLDFPADSLLSRFSFPRLHTLRFRDTAQVTALDKHLSSFPALSSIEVPHGKVHFSPNCSGSFPSVTNVQLHGAEVTEADVTACLRAFPSMKYLTLQANVGAFALRHLCKQPHAQLSQAWFLDYDVKVAPTAEQLHLLISRCPRLKSIWLCEGALSDKEMTALKSSQLLLLPGASGPRSCTVTVGDKTVDLSSDKV